MAVSRTKARATTEKKTCLYCGNDFAISSFYLHRNPLINNKFGFCKKCVKNNINLNDMDTFEDFLRTMDLPYLKEYWKQANDSDWETIGTYFKNLGLKQNVNLRYRDGDEISRKTNKSLLAEIEHEEDFEITDKVLKRWGRNLQYEDYLFMEEEFEAIGGNEAETTVQEKIYINIVKTQWMANKAIEDNDYGRYEKMIKILSTQMQDANIKPVQVKSASEDGSLNNWGEWVKKIEETEPCIDEEHDYEPKFIKKYVERWFVHQIKRIFGLAKEDDVEKLDGEM